MAEQTQFEAPSEADVDLERKKTQNEPGYWIDLAKKNAADNRVIYLSED